MSIAMVTKGRLWPVNEIIRELYDNIECTVEDPVLIECDVTGIEEITCVEIEVREMEGC